MLAPNSVQEAADLTRLAFELADKYRNPAMILADGTIGQMMETVVFADPIQPEDLPAKDWAMTGCAGRAPRKAEPKNSAEDLEAHNIHLQNKYARAIAWSFVQRAMIKAIFAPCARAD